jgi:hypothetical protein
LLASEDQWEACELGIVDEEAIGRSLSLQRGCALTEAKPPMPAEISTCSADMYDTMPPVCLSSALPSSWSTAMP